MANEQQKDAGKIVISAAVGGVIGWLLHKPAKGQVILHFVNDQTTAVYLSIEKQDGTPVIDATQVPFDAILPDGEYIIHNINNAAG